MKNDMLINLVACDPNIGIENIEGFEICIDNNDYIFSLLSIQDEQDEQEIDDYSVIVKIIGFSCNYRDKGFLAHFLKRCQNSNENLYTSFGSEFVGEVIKVGRFVTSFKTGDRVMSDNSYPLKINNKIGGIITNTASKRIHIFKEFELIKVPDLMTDAEAAAFSLSAQTSSSIIKKAHLRKGDKVLVTSIFSNTSLSCLELLKNIADIEIYALTTHRDNACQITNQFNIKHIFEQADLSINNGSLGILFDVIIDPFVDLHISYLSKHLNYNSKYISCGITNFCNNINSHEVFYNIIKTNSEFIGNCLGTREDLEEMINKFLNHKYNVHIDSVHFGNQVLSFINKTFNETHVGKVIYLY